METATAKYVLMKERSVDNAPQAIRRTVFVFVLFYFEQNKVCNEGNSQARKGRYFQARKGAHVRCAAARINTKWAVAGWILHRTAAAVGSGGRPLNHTILELGY